jgi:hypothetical protein
MYESGIQREQEEESGKPRKPGWKPGSAGGVVRAGKRREGCEQMLTIRRPQLVGSCGPCYPATCGRLCTTDGTMSAVLDSSRDDRRRPESQRARGIQHDHRRGLEHLQFYLDETIE